MATYPDEREGPGRWVPIKSPAAGVLWVSDAGSIGFQPTPIPGIDPTPVLEALQTAFDAGRTADEAFTMLTGLVGTVVTTGNLDNWTPDRRRRGLTATAKVTP